MVEDLPGFGRPSTDKKHHQNKGNGNKNYNQA